MLYLTREGDSSMEFDVWKPLYVDEFEYDKYLYHYTNIESAIKIICSNTLLFSSLNHTNDLLEAKMKIIFEKNDITDWSKYPEKVKSISSYFKQHSQIVQLLCFSMDTKITKTEKKKYKGMVGNKDMYFDVSGRGFALPRMWAQYAGNNVGVCFVFNKNKLVELCEDKIAFIKHDCVKYKNFLDAYYIGEKRMDALYKKFSMVENGSLPLVDMIQNDKEFLKYNFFTKLNDWANEQEYRIIALTDRKDKKNFRLSINGVLLCLEGIVVGAKIDDSYERVIKLLVESCKKKLKIDKMEVKKIQFDNHMCKLH